MRDSWAEWETAPYPTYLHYLAKARAEARAFRAATAIIATTERMRDLFLRCHRNLDSSKFHYIPNGFEGSLFNRSHIVESVPSGQIDIAYIGNYYYNPRRKRSLSKPHSLLQYSRKKEDWSYRSPEYFFRAWQKLRRTNPGAAKRIRFHHIGPIPSWLEPMIAEYGVQAQCRLWGSIPKQNVPIVLNDMNFLLATSMKRLDGGDYFLASKTFDYLKANKPIIGFVTQGAQRDFLINSGVALIADPDNPSEGATILNQLICQSLTFTLNNDFVNEFHRRNTALQLANLLAQYT